MFHCGECLLIAWTWTCIYVSIYAHVYLGGTNVCGMHVCCLYIEWLVWCLCVHVCAVCMYTYACLTWHDYTFLIWDKPAWGVEGWHFLGFMAFSWVVILCIKKIKLSTHGEKSLFDRSEGCLWFLNVIEGRGKRGKQEEGGREERKGR